MINYSFILKEKEKLENIVDIARKTGKSDAEIKLLLDIALKEMKKKFQEKEIF